MYVCENKICGHKSLFNNIHGLEILMLIMIFFTFILGNIAGIGGGSIIVPLIAILIDLP